MGAGSLGGMNGWSSQARGELRQRCIDAEPRRGGDSFGRHPVGKRNLNGQMGAAGGVLLFDGRQPRDRKSIGDTHQRRQRENAPAPAPPRAPAASPPTGTAGPPPPARAPDRGGRGGGGGAGDV